MHKRLFDSLIILLLTFFFVIAPGCEKNEPAPFVNTPHDDSGNRGSSDAGVDEVDATTTDSEDRRVETDSNNPIGPLDESSISYKGDGVPSDDLMVDAYGEQFTIYITIPNISPDYEGPYPEGFDFYWETTCDGDTPDDESDDVRNSMGGESNPPGSDYPIWFDPQEFCKGRRIMDGEKITIFFQVSWDAPDGSSYSSEVKIVLTGVGGINAGEFDPELIIPTPLTECEGGKYDPDTDLCWQDPPPFGTGSSDMMQGSDTWTGAKAYCEELSSGGHDDWRLPTVDDLRTLIRAPYTYSPCAKNLPGGDCGITDPDCLREDPCADGCDQCHAHWAGSGEDHGCYWPQEFNGSCIVQSTWWSSSEVKDKPGFYWVVSYYGGNISNREAGAGAAAPNEVGMATGIFFRCVRSVL